jgi:hypothetical protein
MRHIRHHGSYIVTKASALFPAPETETARIFPFLGMITQTNIDRVVLLMSSLDSVELL